MRDIHQKVGHAGRNHMLSRLGQKFLHRRLFPSFLPQPRTSPGSPSIRLRLPPCLLMSLRLCHQSASGPFTPQGTLVLPLCSRARGHGGEHPEFLSSRDHPTLLVTGWGGVLLHGQEGQVPETLYRLPRPEQHHGEEQLSQARPEKCLPSGPHPRRS